jgi:hypothetical protein
MSRYVSGSCNHGIRISFKEQPLDETESFTVLMLILLPIPIIIVANPQNWCRGELQKYC